MKKSNFNTPRLGNSFKRGNTSILGWNRKSILRLLNNQAQKTKGSGRPKKYSLEAIKHLCKLWKGMEQMCFRKMVVALHTWVAVLQGVFRICEAGNFKHECQHHRSLFTPLSGSLEKSFAIRYKTGFHEV